MSNTIARWFLPFSRLTGLCVNLSATLIYSQINQSLFFSDKIKRAQVDPNFQENLTFSLAGFSSGVAIATTTYARTVTTRILQQWTTPLIITSFMATI